MCPHCCQKGKVDSSQGTQEKDDPYFIELQAQGPMKKCPYEDCQVSIIKSDGCDHMICPSGQRDFHWELGKWKKQHDRGFLNTGIYSNLVEE